MKIAELVTEMHVTSFCTDLFKQICIMVFEFKSQICMLMQVWLFSNDQLVRGITQIPLKPFFTSQHSNAWP